MFVGRSNVVLLIQAFRRGEVPSLELGGDGALSFTALEIADAKRLGKPILAFVAEDTWPGRLWEERDEYGPYKLERFKSLVRYQLLRFVLDLLRTGELAAPRPRTASEATASDLRPPAPPPALPEEPYPLLAPYWHPRTFGGRDGEVDILSALLDRDRPVLLLHAPSGAGKSSLLLAGLGWTTGSLATRANSAGSRSGLELWPNASANSTGARTSFSLKEPHCALPT